MQIFDYTDDQLQELSERKLKSAETDYRVTYALLGVLDKAARVLDKDEIKLFNKSVVHPARRKNAKASQAIMFWKDPVAVKAWVKNKAEIDELINEADPR